MTLSTAQEHRKGREQAESENWKRCNYCDTYNHMTEWFTDSEGLKFCNEHHAEFYKEEVLNEG